MGRYTLTQFNREFPSEERCLEKLMVLQHGSTKIDCPGCGVHSQFHPLAKRKAFCCQECGHAIYPCANTIFHKSSTKLTTWFLAMYLLTNTRHGVSAKELQRQTGVTYKTAWRILHELRKLMATADFGGMLSGHVEIDETVVGGYQKRKDKRNKGTNKSVVYGMVEREGNIRTGIIPDTSLPTMQGPILANVEKGSTISTDEHRSYHSLYEHAYGHGVVKHRYGEYVRDEHHTNTIEGHWSLLKRSIKGTHTSVSKKHLWKYVAEFSYRRNFNKSQEDMFNRLFSACGLPRLAES
jgi:transposase